MGSDNLFSFTTTATADPEPVGYTADEVWIAELSVEDWQIVAVAAGLVQPRGSLCV